jgi:beta-galactosidase
MGFLVLDEAFDEWRYAKVENGYHKYFAEWAEKDLTDFIVRDRNHPSIIMWSIGNEIIDQRHADGKDTARFLTEICHLVDNTRPVTCGFNDSDAAIKNGLASEVDIPGFNYKPHLYEKYTKEHPEWIMYGSETESCISSRGIYHFPVKEDIPATLKDDIHFTSYDMAGPAWAYAPDREFEVQDRMKHILGEYVWTGFDYIGEPTPYYKEWPSRSSYFGIVDLCGIPKDRYYSYMAKWTDKDVLHILPHWDFEERIGEVTPVHVYTNYNKGELFVNSKSHGVIKKNDTNEYTKNRLIWDDVVYETGEIRVVVFDDDDNIAMEKTVKTSSAPAKIATYADREVIDADGDDLTFITIEIQDADSNFCARANNLVNIEVEGAGELIAVDNGDQTSIKPFKRNQVECFNGKAVVIIRSKLNESGNIVIRFSSCGLKSSEMIIKAK